MHIGSGTDLEHLRHVCQALEKTARDVGRSITGISAGGGLPVPYRAEQSYVDLDAYFKLWDATRKRLEDAFGHKVRLEIEPGRYLVAEAAFWSAEIRAIKQMGGNTFYLLDAGFNNLARPILYGAYHPMSIVPQSRQRRQNGRCTTWSSAGRCASRAISSRKKKAASSARGRCRRPKWASIW